MLITLLFGRVVRGATRLFCGVALVFVSLTPRAQGRQSGESYRNVVLTIQRHIEGNDLEGARTLIDQAAKQFPGDGGIENLCGVVEIREGHTESARKAFSEAIRHDPKLVSAYLNLGRVFMEGARSNESGRVEALRVYETLLRFKPDNSEANFQAATLFMWMGDYQGSLRRLTHLGSEDRDRPGVLSLRCADEAALGRMKETDRDAAALAASPELSEQDAKTVLPTLRTANRADLVESIFAAADSRKSLSADGVRILGLAQEEAGKLAAARSSLERAYAADPTRVAPLVDLARVANATRDYQGALGYLAHARDMTPGDARLPYEFGVVCVKMSLVEEAYKAIKEALRLEPNNPAYNLAMGAVASYGHDPAEALPFLEKYRAFRPEDPSGALALGIAYFRAKDYEGADPYLKTAAKNEPVAPTALYYLGRIARAKGQLDDAVGELTQSTKLKSDQPEVMAELGQIYVQMGRYADAATELERALELDADSYAANFGLLQLYVHTGDAKRAEQSERFEEIKKKNEQQSREMMRVIEFHP